MRPVLYVTEKLFNRMTDHVVVARGGGPSDQVAPPHSYINADDFASAKELADYLYFLAENDTEYLSYFWWEDYYTMVANDDNWQRCELCAMLHDESLPAKSHLYHICRI